MHRGRERGRYIQWVSLLAWFSHLFETRRHSTPPPFRLKRAAVVQPPFDLMHELGTDYDPGVRQAPAFDSPAFPQLVAAVREAIE